MVGSQTNRILPLRRPRSRSVSLTAATCFSDADPRPYVDAQRFRLQELQDGRAVLVLGQRGRYTIGFVEGPADFVVRIEADGYEPAWQSVTGPSCDFELTKLASSP